MKSNYETVPLGIKRLSSSALAGKGRLVVGKMDGNPHFPDSGPMLAELAAACDALETASQRYDFSRGRQDLAERNRCYERVHYMMFQVASLVQVASHGEERVIMGAGFDVKRKRQASRPMQAPQNVQALRTEFPGTVKLRWAGVKHRQFYEVQVTSGDPADPKGWRMLAQTARNYYVASQLPSDQVHYFRTLAVGASGPGPFSDITSAKAA